MRDHFMPPGIRIATIVLAGCLCPPQSARALESRAYAGPVPSTTTRPPMWRADGWPPLRGHRKGRMDISRRSHILAVHLTSDKPTVAVLKLAVPDEDLRTYRSGQLDYNGYAVIGEPQYVGNEVTLTVPANAVAFRRMTPEKVENRTTHVELDGSAFTITGYRWSQEVVNLDIEVSRGTLFQILPKDELVIIPQAPEAKGDPRVHEAQVTNLPLDAETHESDILTVPIPVTVESKGASTRTAMVARVDSSDVLDSLNIPSPANPGQQEDDVPTPARTLTFQNAVVLDGDATLYGLGVGFGREPRRIRNTRPAQLLPATVRKDADPFRPVWDYQQARLWYVDAHYLHLADNREGGGDDEAGYSLAGIAEFMKRPMRLGFIQPTDDFVPYYSLAATAGTLRFSDLYRQNTVGLSLGLGLSRRWFVTASGDWIWAREDQDDWEDGPLGAVALHYEVQPSMGMTLSAEYVTDSKVTDGRSWAAYVEAPLAPNRVNMARLGWYEGGAVLITLRLGFEH